MKVFSVTDAPPVVTDPLVLCIGKFDGVHIGHKKILDRAKAVQGGADLAVMSLWPHPAFVLGGKVEFDHALTPDGEKIRLLRAEGVRTLFAVQFSQQYAATSAASFVREHLGRLCGLRAVVVGADFRFGQGGVGDVALLTSLCQEMGITVHVVNPVEENGVKVGSSQIRRHLAAGRVEAAEVLLGRPYSLTGVVVHGDARGRELGFPTANLRLDEPYVLPAAGVYAVTVAQVDRSQGNESHWLGVLNAGLRPTVDGTEFRLEAHVLDFAEDLYGETLRVSFLHRVRDERKFAGLGELRQQIEADVAYVRQLFQGH